MPTLSVNQLLRRGNSFADQLSDPQWEEFRSGFLSRNGNVCISCRRSNVIIQVHHIAYEPGRKRWEYSDDECIALCKGCHESWHKVMKAFRNTAGRIPVNELQMVVAGIAVLLKLHSGRDVAFALCQLAAEPYTVRKLHHIWAKQP